MFKKLGFGLQSFGRAGSKNSKGQLKCRFELKVDQLENVPAAVGKCRVMWTRNAKIQYTSVKPVRTGEDKGGGTPGKPGRTPGKLGCERVLLPG